MISNDTKCAAGTVTSPVVTVVIPVYNSAPTLRRAMQSALTQSLRDIEVLVVDDCSTDDGLAIAREAASADPRVQVIALDRNGGAPRAINVALEHARGEWMAMLDADDSFRPQRLEKLVALGRRHGTAMVADDQDHIDSATGEVITTAFQGCRFDNPMAKDQFLELAGNPHKEFDGGILKPVVRLDFLRNHGVRYNEKARIGYDFYFLLDFFTRGGTLWIEHEPLYVWTMPFSTRTRQWTTTGDGPWRYDFRRVLPAHEDYVRQMERQGDAATLAMLTTRGQRLRQMIHYTDAQKAAAEGRAFEAFRTLALHPPTYPVLARRIVRRLSRAVQFQPVLTRLRAATQRG